MANATTVPKPIVRTGDAYPPSQPGPHALPIEEVLLAYGTDMSRGLSNSRVVTLQASHGHNELVKAPATPLWRKLGGQFKEPVILILIFAAVLSGVMHECVDSVIILAIVLLNGVFGFLQEEHAGRALAALQRLSRPRSRVIRDGEKRVVAARELVPGDRIELEAGDEIPADARLINAAGFRVEEAALTGESVPVDKDPQGVLDQAVPLAERRNMVYMGTLAVGGKASAVVVATGMNTQLGRIADMLQRDEPEPTPLQRRLAELGRVLIAACLGVVAVIFVLRLLRGGNVVDVFLRAVSLAVAAVPEGLPAVVTRLRSTG